MNRKHLLQSVVLITLAYFLFRWIGLVGPAPAPNLTRTETQVLYLLIALISFGGLIRWITSDDAPPGSSG
jgi:hypothetical protein